jgi:hypothetical protein
MTPLRVPPEVRPVAGAREDVLDPKGKNARLRIYIGEDKRHGCDEVRVLLYPSIPREK